MNTSTNIKLISLPKTFSDSDNYELKLSNSLIDSTADLSKGELELLYIIFYLVQTKGLGFELAEITLREMKSFIGNKSNAYYDEMRESVRSLSKRYIEVDTGKKGGFLIASWLSSAEYKEERASIEFSLDEKLRPYLTDFIDNYTILSFFIVIQFHSAHVRRLYLFLKKHENSTMIELSVDEFRKVFKVPDHVHSSFKELKRNLILHPQRTFKKKDKYGNFLSDINFTVKTIREGRKVARLQIFPESQKFQPPLPLHLEDPFQEDKTKIIAYLSSISIAQPLANKWIDMYGIEYVNKKIEFLKEEEKSGEVKNPAGLMRAAIEKDYKNTKKEKEKEERKKAEKIKVKRLEEAKEKQEQKNQEEAKRKASLIIRNQFISTLSEEKKMEYVEKINADFMTPSRKIKTANNATFKNIIAQYIPDFEQKLEALVQTKNLEELQKIEKSVLPEREKALIAPQKRRKRVSRIDAEKKLKTDYINSLSKEGIQKALEEMKQVQPELKGMISDIWGSIEFPLLRYVISDYDKKLEELMS